MPEPLAINTAQSVADGERERLQLMFDRAPGFMALFEGPDHKVVMANQAFASLVGRSDFTGKAVSEAMPELTLQGFADLLDGVAQSGEPMVAKAMSLRVAGSSGASEEILVDLVLQPLPGNGERPQSIFLQGHEVTEDRQSESLRAAHTRVLELAIGDSPLEETLSALIRIVESTSKTGVLGSILLLDADGKHLRHGAAPSLPQPYIDAINGAAIGPSAGSCGTAAYRTTPVFVSDIATDPLWAEYKVVALPHGLRACWSTPILASGRRVLGTFAMYHREPREPTVRDLTLVDLITQTAALVIDRRRAQGHSEKSTR
jgi:hypothetical protein